MILCTECVHSKTCIQEPNTNAARCTAECAEYYKARTPQMRWYHNNKEKAKQISYSWSVRNKEHVRMCARLYYRNKLRPAALEKKVCCTICGSKLGLHQRKYCDKCRITVYLVQHNECSKRYNARLKLRRAHV